MFQWISYHICMHAYQHVCCVHIYLHCMVWEIILYQVHVHLSQSIIYLPQLIRYLPPIKWPNVIIWGSQYQGLCQQKYTVHVIVPVPLIELMLNFNWVGSIFLSTVIKGTIKRRYKQKLHHVESNASGEGEHCCLWGNPLQMMWYDAVSFKTLILFINNLRECYFYRKYCCYV